MGLTAAIYTFNVDPPSYDVVWRRVCELEGRPVQMERFDTSLKDDENSQYLGKQKHASTILLSGSSITFRRPGERKLWIKLTKSLRGDQMVASGNNLPLMDLVCKALSELGSISDGP